MLLRQIKYFAAIVDTNSFTEAAEKNGAPHVHDGLFARASSTSAIDAYLKANGFIN